MRKYFITNSLKLFIVSVIIVTLFFSCLIVGLIGLMLEGEDGDESIPFFNEPPTANAGSDYIVDTGNVISFNGIGSDLDGSIVKYEWDFNGDGIYDWSSTTTGSVNHTYNMAGTYTAKLRVTDNRSATSIDTCIITVNLFITRSPEEMVLALTDMPVGWQLLSEGFINKSYSGYNSGYSREFVKGGTYSYILLDVDVMKFNSTEDAQVAFEDIKNEIFSEYSTESVNFGDEGFYYLIYEEVTIKMQEIYFIKANVIICLYSDNYLQLFSKSDLKNYAGIVEDKIY